MKNKVTCDWVWKYTGLDVGFPENRTWRCGKGRPCKEATVLVGKLGGGTFCPKKRGFNMESEFKSNCGFLAIA